MREREGKDGWSLGGAKAVFAKVSWKRPFDIAVLLNDRDPAWFDAYRINYRTGPAPFPSTALGSHCFLPQASGSCSTRTTATTITFGTRTCGRAWGLASWTVLPFPPIMPGPRTEGELIETGA